MAKVIKCFGILCSIFVVVIAHDDSCEDQESFQCGRRSVNQYSAAIASGAETRASDWPWFAMVLEQQTNNNDKIYRYDGIIISRKAVLTCGYCVYINNQRIPLNRLLVQVGTSNFNDANDIGRQVVPVVKVVVHPGFDIEKSRATSNLALLFVNRLVFTEYVQPICIFGPLYDKSDLFGKQAVGASFASRSVTMDRIQPLYSVIQNDETCIAHVPGHATWLNEFDFCAGDILGQSPDSGRGGTGLAVGEVQPDSTVTWYLHGIFSHCGGEAGTGNCDLNSLKLFTNVAPHYAWIYHNVFDR